MKRKRFSKTRSKRNFRNGAKIHNKNKTSARPMRGGWRI